MTKLTTTQLSVLSRAAARDDGAASLPEHLTRSAAAKVAASLVSRKLMREVRAKAGMPVWRVDGDRKVALVILKAGRSAILVDTQPTERPADTKRTPPPTAPDEAKEPSSKPLQDALNTPPPIAADAPRQGSKQALVVELLARREGATIDALIEATGWLPHTTRAALTGLRRRGYGIERTRGVDGATRYWLSPVPADVQA
ncbi:MAG: uncharacterized protein JWM36_2092 [Hyphomicrobiales bacterium]|nr:uncharacterized protein [Hyphomicrobiales bacterium]